MAYNDKTPAHKDSLERAGHKATPVPPSAPPRDVSRNTRTGSGKKQVTAREREQMIATVAYFRAERRGFASGAEVEDWLQAEAEVDRMLQR